MAGDVGLLEVLTGVGGVEIMCLIAGQMELSAVGVLQSARAADGVFVSGAPFDLGGYQSVYHGKVVILSLALGFSSWWW